MGNCASGGFWFGFGFRFLLRCQFGVFVFALASALCLRASNVAPVRGGTYFSLPPQRKVGKRKRLTPPALDVCPRAPNVPTLRTVARLHRFVANASFKRLTHFQHPYMGSRQRTATAAQVANCV
ncbi:UNVERIFIED_ORG: hypothetical protein BDU10_2159 [Burkholderia sp. CF145]